MKTSDLKGTALDWAVAKCEHPHLVYGETIGVHHASNQIVIPEFDEPECYYNPSTNWAQGGRIIEREHIHLRHGVYIGGQLKWEAAKDVVPQPFEFVFEDSTWFGVANTPLIAAMRCYCCAKLGDEVEIPEELK